LQCARFGADHCKAHGNFCILHVLRYSSTIVVDEAFVLHVPPGLDLAATAPLL
jgi:D-arabinose 1-dehydrogenase-like Zn-dependent alcohol dehydrogenase